MKDSPVFDTPSDLSAKKWLNIVIASMVIVILGLALLGMFGMETISGLRSFVGAEGLWSKSQKNATIHLVRYAYSRDERDYDAFKEHLEVPFGDKRARRPWKSSMFSFLMFLMILSPLLRDWERQGPEISA
jgi:hypothetical protein